jgi:hypothetical protein
VRIIPIACLLSILLPFVAFSQDQAAPQMSEETKKMMEAWSKLAMPGEQHKQLMTLAGTYKVKSRFKMDPAGPFVDSGATCEKKAVLGDRYISEHCNGESMMGMPPFEGMGMLGFNNYTKQYESFWFDNMSTMGFAMKGTADAAGKTITVKGSYEDPVSKQQRLSRWVWTIQDANQHKLEIYETDSKEREYLSAELMYTRQ